MVNQLSKKLAASKDQVKEAYTNGATLRDIAELYDVSSGTVRNLLIELGVELRSRGRKKNPNRSVSKTIDLDSVVLEGKTDTSSVLVEGKPGASEEHLLYLSNEVQ
jgi:transposase-like protein